MNSKAKSVILKHRKKAELAKRKHKAELMLAPVKRSQRASVRRARKLQTEII